MIFSKSLPTFVLKYKIMKLILTFLLLIIPYFGSRESPLKEEVEYIPTVYLEEVVIFGSKYDVINDTSILIPEFKAKVALFLEDCKSQRIDLIIFETWRSNERQNALKKKGRSKLSGGHSKHQHCMAIDVVPLVNGKPKWRGKGLNATWAKIGKIGEKHGMRWGGRWKFYDPGHLEYIPSSDTTKINV